MRRKRVCLTTSLKDMTFTQVKQLARDFCPQKTNADIAEEAGIGAETIRRYFTDPNYHPTAPNLPKLCGIIGNDLMIEWLVIQRGAHMTYISEPDDAEISIQKKMAEVIRETGDVLNAHADAMGEGNYDYDSLSVMEKELHDCAKKVQEAILLIEKIKKETVRDKKICPLE